MSLEPSKTKTKGVKFSGVKEEVHAKKTKERLNSEEELRIQNLKGLNRFKITPYDSLLFKEYIKNYDDGFLRLVTENPQLVANQMEEIKLGETTKKLQKKYVENYPEYTPSVYFNALDIAKYDKSKVQQFLRDDEKKRLTLLVTQFKHFFLTTTTTLEDYLKLIESAHSTNHEEQRLLQGDKKKVDELFGEYENLYNETIKAQDEGRQDDHQNLLRETQEKINQIIYYILSINMWSMVENILDETFDFKVEDYLRKTKFPQLIFNLYENNYETMTPETLKAVLTTHQNMIRLNQESIDSIDEYLLQKDYHFHEENFFSRMKKLRSQLTYDNTCYYNQILIIEELLKRQPPNPSSRSSFTTPPPSKPSSHSSQIASLLFTTPPNPALRLSVPSMLFSSQQQVKKVPNEPLHDRIKKIIRDSIRTRISMRGGGYKKSRKLKLNKNKMSRKSNNKMSRKSNNKMSRKSNNKISKGVKL